MKQRTPGIKAPRRVVSPTLLARALGLIMERLASMDTHYSPAGPGVSQEWDEVTDALLKAGKDT